MKIFEYKLFFRYLFVIVAMVIAFGSLIVSHYLVKDLSREEANKITVWAEATKEFVSSDNNISMNLIVQIQASNTTIPAILYDKKENFYISTNIELPDEDQQEFLKEKVAAFEKKHEPIVIDVEDFDQYVYYDDSYTLKRLQIFPYIQLAVLTIFVITSLLAIMSTKRMEQDRLWVGLSKETAHQLGTPISSLMAWTEYLRMKDVDPSIVTDMEKDVNRLQMITDRFSKIGSAPVLERKEVNELIRQTITYLQKRISKKVIFELDIPSTPLYANISESLFSWVIENLTKNAVDAMEGIGRITFTLFDKGGIICLDISDTGKGIPKSKFQAIFNPGYTTKARGWGLGLSLAKRIIESYHKGKVYVKSSDINVGTTFCIELKKVD
ncbi:MULTISPECIES: sensor histidine kinase [unclassified Dysgonomonas]|uniref:sensor histidine kinase n=1 Tax=unclassified Dysgonomonas TaxID=2630389 RepID=UPI0013EB6037|nr:MULTISPECIES: HAMP domain-containing sensor histidine kinase [unclassified Dysgonomonas]